MSVTSSARLTGTRTVTVGVHEDDHVTPEETRKRFPAAKVGRVFIPPLKHGAPPEKVYDKILNVTKPWRGGGVYVSYKPSPRAVANGQWTKVHHDIGLWLERNPWVKIIVHHEPEGGDHALEGPVFRDMFTRARNEIKDGWAGATVAYCAMAYQWRSSRNPRWAGDAARNPGAWKEVVADEYLCDVYSGQNGRNGAFDADIALGDHPGWTNWFDEIVRPHLENDEEVVYGLGERGFMDDENRVRATTMNKESDWLDRAFDRYAATRRAVDLPPSVYLGWNSIGTETERDWLWDDDAVEAMRNLTTRYAKHVY
ncbi:hypothetical protein AB0J83_11920 [Actinoplanes sp. NPDC049596]|uniref:hypothetical protein n=1 Tax=unclassified Actinoplanes TaxID=2626549 RepID=UPI003423556F